MTNARQTMIFMAHIMGKKQPVDISHSKANNESEHCPGPKLLYRLDSRLYHLYERLFFMKNLPLVGNCKNRTNTRVFATWPGGYITLPVCVNFRYMLNPTLFTKTRCCIVAASIFFQTNEIITIWKRPFVCL